MGCIRCIGIYSKPFHRHRGNIYVPDYTNGRLYKMCNRIYPRQKRFLDSEYHKLKIGAVKKVEYAPLEPQKKEICNFFLQISTNGYNMGLYIPCIYITLLPLNGLC